MQVNRCDICGEIITLQDDKYILGIVKVDKNPDGKEVEIKTIQDAVRQYQYQASKVKTMEICNNCQLVMAYLYNIRKQEIEKLKGKVEKIWRLKALSQEKKEEKNNGKGNKKI